MRNWQFGGSTFAQFPAADPLTAVRVLVDLAARRPKGGSGPSRLAERRFRSTLEGYVGASFVQLRVRAAGWPARVCHPRTSPLCYRTSEAPEAAAGA